MCLLYSLHIAHFESTRFTIKDFLKQTTKDKLTHSILFEFQHPDIQKRIKQLDSNQLIWSPAWTPCGICLSAINDKSEIVQQ